MKISTSGDSDSPASSMSRRSTRRLGNSRERTATSGGIHAAPADGTVYVYDESARRTVYQRDVKRGNSFQIFPANDYVNVNSKKAADVRLSANGRYSLYFVGGK